MAGRMGLKRLLDLVYHGSVTVLERAVSEHGANSNQPVLSS